MQLSFVAVEGVIGAGKTSLTERLAERWSGTAVLEEHEENPFLTKFYKDKRSAAFQAQVFFLLTRFKQQMDLRQMDLFSSPFVCDYLFEKDRIFAEENLDESELVLYNRLYAQLAWQVKKPDLVVFLQASTNHLMENIADRGRECEKEMDRGYIARLVRAYHQYFFSYDQTPLLIVNADAIDYVNNPDHFERLARAVESASSGTNFLNLARERERAWAG